MSAEKPSTIVIFGASGDLTWRKLVPALYNVFAKGRLPEGTRIVGFARNAMTDSEFRARLQDGVQRFSADSYDQAAWEAFAPRLSYVTGDLTNGDDFHALAKKLQALDGGRADRLYYLAVAPRFFAPTAANLGAAGLAQPAGGRADIVIEKPFGRDLASARALNRRVHEFFSESQIYRIDHYLGKETAQNILFFRFANTIFEPLWNRNTIDHVQISALETVDVGHRGGYYDQAGVLRDMFQNHLLQLFALVGMEPPASFNADAIRNEKVKLLEAVRPIELKDTVRGQYEGYCGADGVAPGSQTATFAALKLYVDNWRWQGVPFYLRSGKALKEKVSEIVIRFKEPPHVMFPIPADSRITSNTLSICVQPDEGIHLSFEAKVPDTSAGMSTVPMAFHYDDTFGPCAIPEAYQRLLMDAIQGDASLFARSDGIEASWRIIDPVIQGGGTPAAPAVESYTPGSWGPPCAAHLLAGAGRHWIRGCADHHA